MQGGLIKTKRGAHAGAMIGMDALQGCEAGCSSGMVRYISRLLIRFKDNSIT